MRTGHEAGFVRYREFNEKTDYWSPVYEGLTNRITPQSHDEWKHTFLPNWTNHAGSELINVHLHPHYEGPLELSYNDLFLMDGAFPDLGVLAGVGTVSPPGKGNILLLQKTFRGFLSDHLNERPNGIADQFYEHVETIDGELWPKARYAREIELPPYVRSAVLRFQLGEQRTQPRSRWGQFARAPPLDNLDTAGQEPLATILNPNVVRRFGYSYTVPQGDLRELGLAEYRGS